VALSKRWNDRAGYTEGQFFVADIHARENEMKAAEDILPQVNDTAKIDLLIMLSYRYCTRGGSTEADDREKAIVLAQRAREMAARVRLPEKEISALFYIATAHYLQDKKGAQQEYLDVLAKYRAIGFRNLHYVLYMLSNYERNAGNNEKALYYSMETIKSMRSTGDTLAAGDFYAWHSIILQRIDEFQQSIDYGRLAIQAYSVHPGDMPISSIINMTAVSFRKMKRYPEAIQFLEQNLRAYPPETGYDNVSNYVSLGELYTDSKEFAKAERYLLRAKALNKNNDFPAPMLNRDIGRMYLESHQYEKARPFLNASLDDSKNSDSYSSYVHYLLFLVDSAAGHYLDAMNHLHKKNALLDSSVEQSKKKEIQKLLIQFQTKEKEDKLKMQDKDIALLNQKAALQKSELSRSNLIKNIMIGSAVLISLIAFLIYRSYRNKQKSNRMIMQKNEALQRLVKEKEWLLKEVHHRVKNNLHTVICLLESQAHYLDNDALKAIETSQHRIYAMSMIHQKIYQSEDIKTIDMANYLPEFIGYLRESFGCLAHIQFHLAIDPVKMSVAQAIPVALIVNEAVTNSIKYAFPGKRRGEISVVLRQEGERIVLSVADNGIGINKELREAGFNSLGIELMKGLSQEIKGEITIETAKGTWIRVVFKKDRLVEMQPVAELSPEIPITI